MTVWRQQPRGEDPGGAVDSLLAAGRPNWSSEPPGERRASGKHPWFSTGKIFKNLKVLHAAENVEECTFPYLGTGVSPGTTTLKSCWVVFAEAGCAFVI